MSGASHHGHDEHSHRPVWHYLLIAAVLTAVTAFELGPLFDLYNLPAPVLLVLSAFKFIVVVALFMHLWDDSRVFTQIFTAPLIGSGLMILVLMTLFWSFAPASKAVSPVYASMFDNIPANSDPIPVQQRYWTDFSGECQSWLRSHRTNRWYCSSPAIDADRLATYAKPPPPPAREATKIVEAGEAVDSAKPKLVDAGKKLYEQNCQACHQATGLGVPGAFPPLAGSDYITDADKHVQVVLKGLNGEVTVNGQKYNGAMQAFAGTLDDQEIAAIITYERNAWGNALGVVMPEQVAKGR